jgi:hypothetical protein
MPTFTQFWEWLNQGIYIIPTLGSQNGNQNIPTQQVLELENPQEGFFVIQAVDSGGVLVIPNGNQHNFSKEIAQRTWDRFLGMLATSARADGFHHPAGQIATPLPRIFAHQMASAYILPPADHRPSNMHFWFDCPNTITCVFVAAAIRTYLLNNLPQGNLLYSYL